MDERPDRRRMIAAGAAALVLGVVIALVVADDDGDRPPGTTATTGPTAMTTETTPGTTTQAAPAPTDTARQPVPRRDLAAIQTTVTLLVEAAELNDAAGVCRALGQPATGSSPDMAQQCADRAGIDLQALPGSDELSFDRTTLAGPNRARVLLATGDTVELSRANGRWVVTGLSS